MFSPTNQPFYGLSRENWVQRKARLGWNICILKPFLKYRALICPSCKELVEQPIQTSQVGHRYCKECFLKKVEAQMRCLPCQQEGIPRYNDCLLTGAIYPDRGAERDINKLPAECLRCGHQATMIQMETHEHIIG